MASSGQPMSCSIDFLPVPLPGTRISQVPRIRRSLLQPNQLDDTYGIDDADVHGSLPSEATHQLSSNYKDLAGSSRLLHRQHGGYGWSGLRGLRVFFRTSSNTSAASPIYQLARPEPSFPNSRRWRL
jgi:hypothetical protein